MEVVLPSRNRILATLRDARHALRRRGIVVIRRRLPMAVKAVFVTLPMPMLIVRLGLSLNDRLVVKQGMDALNVARHVCHIFH